ncbi:MAG TPA: ABC transporter ATP-binding protein [Dongiaceae bacterium]|jgi:oligopeptide/dipeptide ABC transporter ATP-binding protein|nr:ABC transporter ATP-binding protein [Dongiaceae bacterium]
MSGAAIKGLSVDFATRAGIHQAVRHVDLAAGPGRILGLVGESGSGKSTVALALMGLLAANARATAGTLQLGADRYDLTKPHATAVLRGRRMAMIFQDPFASLNPVFSIRAHLNEVLTRRAPELQREERRKAAIDSLSSVGIDRPELRLAQYPHELSGGMRQRVAIAMALLARPNLLIADEPTTALDATVEAQVMAEICGLRDRIGCSIFFITHSLGLVAQYCDDIAVMYAGELVERGSVKSVAADPGHPYTRALLACEVTIDAPRGADARKTRFRMIPGDLPDPMNPPSGCIYRTRCDIAIEDCARIVPPPVEVGTDPLHRARCIRVGVR